jgi:hypothetical protein
MFFHGDIWVEVAREKLMDKGNNVDMTRLESGMLFLQVKVSMTMREKLCQVRTAICVNRRKITHTRLEAAAGWTICIAL